MNITPVTLVGKSVRLEPLAISHLHELTRAGNDPAVFRWYVEQIRSPTDMRIFVEKALAAQAQGLAVPFATIDQHSGLAVGSTRFGSIDHDQRRVEIGWTWLAPCAQRTAINTEAKYLMMRHAFEVWGCVRIEFKTDSLNDRSRAALVRIGAQEEGTLRNHFITDTGRFRHSVYYSVIEGDWPAVRARLESKLELEPFGKPSAS